LRAIQACAVLRRRHIVKANIIDPTKVGRSVLQHAASVGSLMPPRRWWRSSKRNPLLASAHPTAWKMPTERS
jgi:hypothetical protein